MDSADFRKYRRASVKPGVMIQFKTNGRFFIGLNVLSLGSGGCSVKISTTLAASLHAGDLLCRLVLQHPDFPKFSIQGKVSWIRGKQPDMDAHSVLMGIEFTDAHESFLSALGNGVLEDQKTVR